MAVAGPYYLYPGYSHPQVAIAPSLTYAYVPGALGNVGTYSGLVNVVKRCVELIPIGLCPMFLTLLRSGGYQVDTHCHDVYVCSRVCSDFAGIGFRMKGEAILPPTWYG